MLMNTMGVILHQRAQLLSEALHFRSLHKSSLRSKLHIEQADHPEVYEKPDELS